MGIKSALYDTKSCHQGLIQKYSSERGVSRKMVNDREAEIQHLAINNKDNSNNNLGNEN